MNLKHSWKKWDFNYFVWSILSYCSIVVVVVEQWSPHQYNTSSGAVTINYETTVDETIGTNLTTSIGGTLTTTSTGVGTVTLNGTGSQVTAKNGSGVAIGLTTHTHTDPSGIAGSETSTPN